MTTKPGSTNSDPRGNQLLWALLLLSSLLGGMSLGILLPVSKPISAKSVQSWSQEPVSRHGLNVSKKATETLSNGLGNSNGTPGSIMNGNDKP